ncbi:hypothetical protein BRARA_A01924 [Brassica rapa]|uniref:Uncharacterized protein n=1 Tax=Brassica campestris TaxID=3711 RepID=A0A398AU93_BRACM|nr:hypothetical protein BRARA_A01924 [Brassica rapa]
MYGAHFIGKLKIMALSEQRSNQINFSQPTIFLLHTEYSLALDPSFFLFCCFMFLLGVDFLLSFLSSKCTDNPK